MLGIGKKRFDQPLTSVLGLMAAAALVLTMQSQAEASDFDGRIRGLRLNVGTSVARVSIFVGPHNSPCAAAEWYAFENAHRDIGALWASYLNSALAASRTVFINGTGQCDTSGVEGWASSISGRCPECGAPFVPRALLECEYVPDAVGIFPAISIT
jgi:hypothetical protein